MGDWKRVVLAVLCCLDRVLLAGPPVFGLAEWAVKGENNTAGVSGVDLYPNKGGSWKSSNFFQYLKFERDTVLFKGKPSAFHMWIIEGILQIVSVNAYEAHDDFTKN